jgi:hypothetical protein
MEQKHLEEMLEKVSELYNKYKSDSYMEPKVHNYICNQLSTTLENIERNHVERTQRMEDLTSEQFSFIQSFLFHNHYFYHPTTENFFFYDGQTYQQNSEDDVLYHVLSTLSRDRNLISWKHKTKVSIMKRIKDNHIYQTIPESATIQHVLNTLYPAIFSTKVEAKYFLTILGDNILRKDTSLIHIISSSAKSLLNTLNMLSQIWFGTSLMQSFKFKYHVEHNYSQIRILNGCVGSSSINLNEIGLDILCVACHYSNRYGNSDNYLVKHSNDDKFINEVLYLKTMTPESLIYMFTSEYIRIMPTVAKITTSNGTVLNEFILKPCQISWKNMLYLWKHFLESKHLPSVVFTNKLKSQLTELFVKQYDAETDAFNGINSKYLPSVCKFLQFWDETMVADESELEVGEVASIFKTWSENRREPVINISEKQIADLITYFYPDVDMESDKYIYKMRNTMWDKNLDIQMAMDDLKDKMGIVDASLVSAYDAYVHYCNYGSRPNSLLVSKQYFDKFMNF